MKIMKSIFSLLIVVSVLTLGETPLTAQTTLSIPYGTTGINNSSNANIGVGTTTPGAPLEIAANANGLNIVQGIHNYNGTQTGGNAIGLGFLNELGGAWWKAAIVHERTGGYGVGNLHFLVDDRVSNSTVGLAQARMTITSAGNVGVGTTAPAYKLDVAGDTRATGYAFSSTKNYASYSVTNGDGWYRIAKTHTPGSGGRVRIWYLSGSNKQTDLTFYASSMSYNQGASVMIVDNLFYNGNHIANIRVGTDVANDSWNIDVQLVGVANPTVMKVEVDGNIALLASPELNPTPPAANGLMVVPGNILGGGSSSWSTYLGPGNVGIGTTNPTQKLAVNGTIRAKEVIVDTGWSDYVFASDYKLASLAEVETHIKANGHLPGIPSAKEVAEHGVSMGEMQSKLLAKIEELTLHQIEQGKQMRAQEQRIETLEAENKSLRVH